MGYNITTVDHVVLAVSDLDAAIETWQDTYGLTLSDRHKSPGGFEAALFPMENSLLELVQPIDDNPRNPVRLQIERKGEASSSSRSASTTWTPPSPICAPRAAWSPTPPATSTASRSSAPRTRTARGCS